jgi:hypothetical protein
MSPLWIWVAATVNPAMGPGENCDEHFFQKSYEIGRASAAGRERKLQIPQRTDNLKRVVELLFGCWGHNLSRPFTLSGWTYEVYLNCGKKFAYDRADIGCNVPDYRTSGMH